MAWTQQEYDTLKAAVASGVRIVSYDGPPKRLVEYQSLAEMRALLAAMALDLNGQAGGTTVRYASTSKGV